MTSINYFEDNIDPRIFTYGLNDRVYKVFFLEKKKISKVSIVRTEICIPETEVFKSIQLNLLPTRTEWKILILMLTRSSTLAKNETKKTYFFSFLI